VADSPGAAFAITAVTSEVILDDANRGEASFTVTNRTADVVRGRAAAVPQEPAQAAWLRLVGDAERGFAPNATEQYTVAIAVPAGVPEGRRTLRLDVTALTPPHTGSVRGPDVVYQNRLVPPPRGCYVATLVGAVLGALVGAAVGALPAVVVALASGLKVGLGAELTVLGGGSGVIGFAGLVAGVWLNLRQGRCSGARETALVLAAVAGVVWIVLGLLLLAVSLFARVPGPVILAAIVVGVLGPPVPARYAYLNLLPRLPWLGGSA
jgi:hypothetical protein